MTAQYNSIQQESNNGYNEEDNLPENNIRVQTINSKLANIEVGIEEEKNMRFKAFDKKIYALDDKITKSQLADESKFKLLRDQVYKLQEGISEERVTREEYELRKTKELKNAESNMGADIMLNKQTQKEINSANSKLADENIFSLRLELAKGKKLREETEGKLIKEIEERILNVEDDLESEKKVREENAEKLIRKISEQIQKINESMEKDRKMKEESQTTMFRMIEDMHTKLIQSIEQERQEREEEEDVLIKLLEDTCTHVENKIIADRKAKNVN